MRFIKAGREALEVALAEQLKTALAKGTVTLLVPGGSNITSVVKVMDSIGRDNTDKLTLLLSDERYGPIDHPDSNYYQMKQAGLNLQRATFVETLSGSSLEDTVSYYAKAAEKLMSEANTVIAFLGMGADSHVAGILPNSPAVEALNEWVVGYQAKDFVRLTLTPFALSHVSCAIIGAYGSEKGSALRALAEQNVSASEQPAQILKHIPDVSIYNDQLDASV